MRGKSHAALGRYLLREYLPGISRAQARAFLIGCIEPDRNPATYLKGSIRSRWMHGHNYENAHRLISRLAVRLERKRLTTLWDYYSLGKLMHYTVDAFTYAHNEHFPKKLSDHRRYEVRLQIFFLRRLHSLQKPANAPLCSAAALIRRKHAQYMHLPGSVETDTAYAFTVCCDVMEILTANFRESQEYQFQSGHKDGILIS